MMVNPLLGSMGSQQPDKRRNILSKKVYLPALLVLTALIAFGMFQPVAAQQMHGCSASGLFSSCKAICFAYETPCCSSGFLGLSVSCTCKRDGQPTLDTTRLSVSSCQQQRFNNYMAALQGLGSPEAQQLAVIDQAMQQAAQDGDAEAYAYWAALHEELIVKLSEEELAVLLEAANKPCVLPIDPVELSY